MVTPRHAGSPPIRWVFFDIGDTLFDEDVPHLYLFHSILLALRRNGIDVGWDEYHARIQACIRTNPSTAPADAGRDFTGDDARWTKIYHEARAEYEEMREPRPYGLLLDNIQPVIEDLARDFKLGIIANQHPPILQALEDYGIGRYFAVKAIDEVVGMSKPDPGLFQWAFGQAGCAADESIMVGDRPDNDIAPAKALGMATIRFRRGIYYALYDPRTEAEYSDVVVTETSRLAAAVRQLAVSRQPISRP